MRSTRTRIIRLLQTATLAASPLFWSALVSSALLAAAPATAPLDLLATLNARGSFQTLIAAIKAAGLEGELKAAGDFTVFAPTDAAFAKLPPRELADLLDPRNKVKLAAILRYHVLPSSLMSREILRYPLLRTLQGQSLTVTLYADRVTVDGAVIIAVDLVCSNGVIHVIDSIVMPR